MRPSCSSLALSITASRICNTPAVLFQVTARMMKTTGECP